MAKKLKNFRLAPEMVEALVLMASEEGVPQAVLLERAIALYKSRRDLQALESLHAKKPSVTMLLPKKEQVVIEKDVAPVRKNDAVGRVVF